MPFDLKNVGAIYQQAITAIFHDMLHVCLELVRGYCQHVAKITFAQIEESLESKENAPNDSLNDDEEKAVTPGKAPSKFGGRVSNLRRAREDGTVVALGVFYLIEV